MWRMRQALRFATGRDDDLDRQGWGVLSFVGIGIGLVWLATAATSLFLPNLVAAAMVLVIDTMLVSTRALQAPASIIAEREQSGERGADVVVGLLLVVRLTALLPLVQSLRLPFVLLAVPVLGRLGGTVFAAAFPPTADGVSRPTGSAVVGAAAVAALVCAALGRAPGLAVGAVCFAVALGLGALWRERRLVGDAGAVRAAIVVTETVALIAFDVVVEVGGG